MRRRTLVSLSGALLLTACAGGPRWQGEAADWLETYREQALAGEARLAPSALTNAITAFKRGGDWNGLAVAHLTRCAIERATDQPLAGCAAYREQQPLGASRTNDAYARWLAGAAVRDDIAFLPVAYRDVAAALADGERALLAERLADIEAPLSRLVALAIAWPQMPDPLPALAACAVVAGQQGWLAAHRVCLRREIAVLKERGDGAAAAEREKRWRLLGS